MGWKRAKTDQQRSKDGRWGTQPEVRGRRAARACLDRAEPSCSGPPGASESPPSITAGAIFPLLVSKFGVRNRNRNQPEARRVQVDPPPTSSPVILWHHCLRTWLLLVLLIPSSGSVLIRLHCGLHSCPFSCITRMNGLGVAADCSNTL